MHIALLDLGTNALGIEVFKLQDGESFIENLNHQTGFPFRIISGDDEAETIAKGIVFFPTTPIFISWKIKIFC